MVRQNRIIGQEKHGRRRIDATRERQTHLVATRPRRCPPREHVLVPRRQQGLCRHHQQIRVNLRFRRAKRKLPLHNAFLTRQDERLAFRLP